MRTQLCILIAAAFLMIGVGCNKSEPTPETQDNAVAGASEAKAEEAKAEEPKAEKAESGEQKAPEGAAGDVDGLDKDVVSAVVKEHADAIRKCYEDEFAKNNELAGKITFQWNIKPDGTVENIKVKDSTLENDEVKNCLTKEIDTWKFQEPKNGSTVEIEYPFEFNTK